MIRPLVLCEHDKRLRLHCVIGGVLSFDVARLAWTLSADGGPIVLSGMDIGLFKNGRISALYMFPDTDVTGVK